MHYLIPVDGKPHSQESIALALRVFELAGNEVTLVHVVATQEPTNATSATEPAPYESALLQAERLLELIAQPLTLLGCTVHKKVLQGLTSDSIAAAARSNSHSVTIVCPGPHSTQDLLLNGSVTAQLSQSHFPGTLVRAREINNAAAELWAVFLLDNSADAFMIRTLAPALSKRLKILVVIPDPTAMVFAAPGSPTSSEEKLLHSERIKGAKEAADSEFARLGLPYEHLVLTTRFKDWLISFLRSNDVALLLIPQAKDGGQKHLDFGLPEEEIFMKAPCPTALCRTTASDT